MGKNKLHMVTKTKSKKSKRRSKKKRTKRMKLNVVDVPLSSSVSLGSKASKGDINYHYQKYYNTFAFLKEIVKGNKQLQKRVCVPDIGEGWMKAFLKVNFVKDKLDSVMPVDTEFTKEQFIKEIEVCMKERLIPINLEIIVPGAGTHANIIIIDSKKKTVELFEPHGSRKDSSELESIYGAYAKVSKKVERFFKQYLPAYRYIRPSEYEPKRGLQYRLDDFSGLCITWSILYLHYRLLNPDIDPKKLVSYLDKKFTKKTLLRYTRYVEEVLKHNV